MLGKANNYKNLRWLWVVCAGVLFDAGQLHARPLSTDVPPRVAELLARDFEVQEAQDVEYCAPAGKPVMMDIYQPVNEEELRPAVLLIHGGGWGGRDKRHKNFLAMSRTFARRGFVVFNINYRLSKEAPAPAAVQDAHCAARFIHTHKKKYRVDPEKVIATGNSAGCHLALMVAMCKSELCTGASNWADAPSKIAAVINRFGITDAYERAFVGKGRRSALNWFSGVKGDPKEMAKKMSPVNYVAVADLPPILTIHGSADSNTPLSQGVRLHEGLRSNGNRSELMVIPEGNHGLHNISAEMEAQIENTVYSFLLRETVL